MRLPRLVSWLRNLLETIQGIALVGIVLLVLLTIILRNFFDHGLVWVFEATGLLMVYLVFLGAPRNLIDNTEIRVDFLSQMVGPRLRKLLWVGQKLVVLAVSVVICVYFYQHMQTSFSRLATPILGIPRLVEFGAVFIGPLLAALVTVWHLIRFARGRIPDEWL